MSKEAQLSLKLDMSERFCLNYAGQILFSFHSKLSGCMLLKILPISFIT